MSHIAAAYIVPEVLLQKLADLYHTDQSEQFWNLISKYEFTPQFSFAGDVMAILVTFLSDHGVDLPCADDDPVLCDLAEGMGLIGCCTPDQAADFLLDVGKMMIMDSQLGGFYDDFTGETWTESTRAMRAALDFLTSGLIRLQTLEGRFLLFVG